MKPNKFERKDRTQIHTGAVFSVVFTGTLLIASSVVQATDLQIYAKPSAPWLAWPSLLYGLWLTHSYFLS